MGKTFTKSNITNNSDDSESYEEYESNIDFYLINSLENVSIIIGLFIIIVFAAVLIINYIKNYLKRNRERTRSIKDNKIYNNIYNKNNISNDYDVLNNNINNSHNNGRRFKNQNKKENKMKHYEMKNINPKYNNNFNNNNNFKNNNFNRNIQFNFENDINNNKFDNNFERFNSNDNNIINFDNNINNINNNFNNNINNNFNNNIFNFNDNNNYKIYEEIGFISANINEEPKIGLGNIGATCYMNATLQCLSHTIKLANYLKKKKNEQFIKSKKLSKQFLEVIKKLWIKSYNRNNTYYEPHKFKELISNMNPLFKGIQANDSKDLINFIIQELHCELNKAKSNQIINLINIDQSNENQMFMNFLEEFKNNQNSIISDIFYFIVETKTECFNCKQKYQMRGINYPIYLYNFQLMYFLTFPLEEVRKYKITRYQCNFNDVNLEDCFIYNQKPDILQGENQMWCRNCGQTAPSQYETIIYSAPVYLILILNRGKGNIYNIKLNFEEIINIGNFVKMKENQDLIYHLYAIVTHIGPSSMGGHFIAFCKSPIDNKWYKYNDAIVEYVGDFFNNIHNFGVPYILFYEKQNQ